MKKNIIIICLLFGAIGLLCYIMVDQRKEKSAINVLEEGRESIEFPQRVDFTKEEKVFMEAYNEILTTEDIPDDLADTPSDPTRSDFAIILLPEEYYGTRAFSFLPLKSRALTKEELIRLACAYGKCPPETILQDHCSYRKGISPEGLSESRRLTTKEDFQLHVSLLEQYAMEGVKPDQPLAQAKEQGTPLCFEVSSTARVWIYPVFELTDEQILQILDWKYGNRMEDFAPKDGQLTHDEARRKAEEVLAKYVTEEKPETIYAVYASAPGAGSLQASSYWNVWVHMGEGVHDYFLKLDGPDGELITWERWGQNAVTEEAYDLPWEQDEPSVSVSDEQLLKCAEQYLEKILGRKLTGSDEISISKNEEKEASALVEVRLSEFTARLSIDKAALEPRGMSLR